MLRCRTGQRVLFLSDITRWLAHIGLSQERIGVGFDEAQNGLEQQYQFIDPKYRTCAHAEIVRLTRRINADQHIASPGCPARPPNPAQGQFARGSAGSHHRRRLLAQCGGES